MARSDADGKEPTIEEINNGEVAKFQGFSTTDGIPSKGTQTADEAAAHAAQAALKDGKTGVAPKPKTAGKVVAAEGDEEDDEHVEGDEETAEAKAARELAESKLTDKQKAAKALQTKLGGKDAKHRSANDRIGQAVAKQRAAERERDEERGARRAEMDELRREIATLKGGLTTPKDGAKQPVDKDAPRATDYEYGELDAAYIRDLAIHETRKAIAVERTAQTAERQTDAQRREAQEFTAKAKVFEAAGLEKFDDFGEVVVQGAKDGVWPLDKPFGDLMFESELGPDIAYYLATHVEEAKKIMAQSPAGQARAFGRLEATFSSTTLDAAEQDEETDATEAGQAQQQQVHKPAQARTSQAPPPPAKRARGAGGKTQVSADTNDFSAFERLAMGQ